MSAENLQKMDDARKPITPTATIGGGAGGKAAGGKKK
jgi:hypothetical protein